MEERKPPAPVANLDQSGKKCTQTGETLTPDQTVKAPEISPKTRRLPEPVERVGGGPLPWTPKPTRMPILNFPSHYPDHLKLPTKEILREALKEFWNETLMLQFCNHVISKLTPLFCAEVEKGELRSNLAESAIMSPVIHLLSHNCDRYAFYDLEQKVKESDEWGKMAKALIEAEAKAQQAPRLAQSTTVAGRKSKANDPIAAERSALLQAYKNEGQKRGLRITDEMIAKAACTTWHDRTPVQRWKRNDHRSVAGDDAAIRRILKEQPHLKKN